MALFGNNTGTQRPISRLSKFEHPSKTTNDKINIMASLDFYGQTAKAVAGKYGQVTSIIDRPSVDPTTTSRPSTRLSRLVAPN